MSKRTWPTRHRRAWRPRRSTRGRSRGQPLPKRAPFSLRRLQRTGLALGDPALELGAVVADEALDRPGGGVAQGADGVAFDLLGNVPQHVDLVHLGIAFAQALHDAPHPAGAFAARGALAAALMLVEIAEARDRPDDVGRLVHDD